MPSLGSTVAFYRWRKCRISVVLAVGRQNVKVTYFAERLRRTVIVWVPIRVIHYLEVAA